MFYLIVYQAIVAGSIGVVNLGEFSSHESCRAASTEMSSKLSGASPRFSNGVLGFSCVKK